MGEPGQRPRSSRRNTAGAATRRSGTSRPTSPDGLHRTVSGPFHLDDQAQYRGHRYHDEHEEHEEVISDESSDDTDITEKENEEANDLEQGSSEDIVSEVRDGIEDQRDVEANPKLEKSKTSKSGRSTRDPNLVGWEGPDDPENPKNWANKRKWAATFVGI